MVDSSLEKFSERVLAKGRISKYDVQHLRRELLGDGITNREQAELLIRLDREVDALHASWPAYFVSAVTEFVVWGARPTGYVDNDKAQWLAGALNAEPSQRAARLVSEVLLEAEQVDQALVAGEPAEVPDRPAVPISTAFATAATPDAVRGAEALARESIFR